jgi:hypothetical protein
MSPIKGLTPDERLKKLRRQNGIVDPIENVEVVQRESGLFLPADLAKKLKPSSGD